MLAAFARRQRGLITYSQLRAAGFSSPAVSRAVRSGRLHRLHRGVYAVGHRGLAPLARELAALLAVGPGAVLGRHSAAALWDMAPALPGAVDVCVRGPGRPNREGLRIHSSSRLDADDVATKHGVLVTRPARTLIDVANAESPRRFSWIAEQARSRRLVSDASLEEAVGRARPAAARRSSVPTYSPERTLFSHARTENAGCSSSCASLACPNPE